MTRLDPLLDDGMVALLRWLENSGAIDLKEIHAKCRETKGDHATIYKRKRSDDDWIEISHRDNPDDPSGRMILSADIYGDGWTIAQEILVIGRRLLTEASQTVLCDPGSRVEATTIIDHPYLSGAMATGGEKKPNLLLTLHRGPATHLLTHGGITKLT